MFEMDLMSKNHDVLGEDLFLCHSSICKLPTFLGSSSSSFIFKTSNIGLRSIHVAVSLVLLFLPPSFTSVL